ncbi:type II CRISPR RNA-guided endonuclease Cas9 [Ilyomonas limi]|uniref:CRISPR-associated endonuclease Cas9 n=1 Tax=Ilyomonas limi TaxID=2575867 RepID=A0A4U3L8Q0_9BACT|nr:type II CRISPR RNA-guided endonuclease Cas9 [Ilyomonas limi]TKK71648.1 type II CRISPR RNA-guided endonuclease Cas9 [Ilyomonas limi]
MNKKILGLDLGTNSIGWALIEEDFDKRIGSIIGMGSRILPMSQDELGKFDSGAPINTGTAERTNFRGIRRLRERHLLRRERLHRVLNLLRFLPEHYAAQIDFKKRVGQFKEESEPKLAYAFDAATNKAEFIFKTSFKEMLNDFAQHQPPLVSDNRKVPYDWTIYHLRKKALTAKIQKEELAWILLNFNQKRGYYQLRGEEEANETPEKKVEFYSLLVTDVEAAEDKKGADTWYNVHLENGWIYRRTSKVPLDWAGKMKEFIVTTDLNEDGTEKTDKEGKVKRSFRAPLENDWTLIKKKTEHDIDKSHKTVGEYIYDTLLATPNQKIKGRLVRVVERKFYKEELKAILEKQKEFHPELNDGDLYNACLEELYQNNEAHQNSIAKKDFTHLLLNDIIFYQRPLKSKKSLISNCKFEERTFVKDGIKQTQPLKGIAKSHPLFQEFRLWQFIQNLKIYKKATPEDENITDTYLSTEDDYVKLFDWLNSRKDIDQKTLLKQYFKVKNADAYRWNYVENKIYPANETRAEILKRLHKANVPEDFLTKEKQEALWHILYSVEDKSEIQKALTTFAYKNSLPDEFIEQFKRFPHLEKEYGSYSAKALKKLLPLMRMGKYWDEQTIIDSTPLYQHNIQQVITNLQNKEKKLTEEDRQRGKTINNKLLEKLQRLADDPAAYKGLEHFLASYLVYGKHSEDSDVLQWKTPAAIEDYLREFKQHSLRNPIVEQVITETLRVVKDVWNFYGNGEENFFDEIHIELGREMKNPAEERKKITAQMNDNENTNLRLKALLSELMRDSEVENIRSYSPYQQDILKIYEEGVLNANDGNIPDDILNISKQALPTASELKRYKLWLEQGYRSPYTGLIIPLNKLFTPAYQIEHIIPQSRYFDDSLSNKVICEAEVNADKGNMTAFEYIKKKGGSKVNGSPITLLAQNDYEDLVKRSFSKSRSKAKKLLMEDIPEGFIERQLNDSRYISKIVKNLLSNIVREDDEREAISKNVVPVTGAVTSQLKHNWGLEHIWNESVTPRFIRLNTLTGTTNFGSINPTTNKFLPQVPLELQKGFNKKRIDHRHHALDALVIACTTKDHINYLHSLNSERKNFSLVSKLREIEEAQVNGTIRKVPKAFIKPWETFTQDAKEKFQHIIVSFKQNTRVITKTNNRYEHWEKDTDGNLKKVPIRQTKGENKAIRKPMHKDTVAGLVKLGFRKMVSLAAALDSWEMITDKELRNEIKLLVSKGYDKKKLLHFFKTKENKWNNKEMSKVEIFYWDVDKYGKPNNAASRVKLDETFNPVMIACITDTGIQRILYNHLYKYNEEKGGKIIEHPELAFSPDGIDELNKNIQELNGGKWHQPIYKVRTYEPRGNKFSIGHTGNKKDKYVEAAKGTNLFFAIYRNEKEKRSFDTIPLNIVIERKKQHLSPVPEKNEQGDILEMYLSPNDLVYVPEEGEKQNIHSINFKDLCKEQVDRIYKIVSFTNNRLYAIPFAVAKSIVDKVEFTQLNKLEFSLDKRSIKDGCIKLKADRLGNITLA